jgi:hypothetical protein
MQAILGKITHITPKPGNDGKARMATPLEIKFKPACVLPRRTKIPEWLKDQTLTLERAVVDVREIGRPGDSLVLTPAESTRWLSPLVVTPAVASGALPRMLQLELRWCKEEKPPEFTVRANGRTWTATFVKEGERLTGSMATAEFFDSPPALPVAFEVTCDKLRTTCTVMPGGVPGTCRLLLPEGEHHRLENAWYAVDILAQNHAGGIAALREQARGVDHFRRPNNLIAYPLEYAGHSDRFRSSWDWSEQMRDARMTCAGGRREGAATRLDLEGVLDEGQSLRSSVNYQLYDELPLLLMQREFRYGKAKEPDGKEKDEKPKEPIDEMKVMGFGFRAAWMAERDGRTGSRVLCTDGERLIATRSVEIGDFLRHGYWRMADGWAIAEHPGRREVMMYFFDTCRPPHLSTWLGLHTFTLEPRWPMLPVRPEESAGYALALTAGELCGAADDGGWVACRNVLPSGDMRCAVIARLRRPGPDTEVSFMLGGESRRLPLQNLLLPGVGAIQWAAAEFPGERANDALQVTVAGIAGRS